MSVWATKWAYEQDVTPCGAKFVLVALADFADAEGHCYPSQKRLAKMTGQSERSVRDHVLMLEEQGFLRRVKRTKADGTRATDEFFLNGPLTAFDPAAKSAGGESLQRQLSPKPPATLSIQPAAKSAAYPLEREPSNEPPLSPYSPPPVTGGGEGGSSPSNEREPRPHQPTAQGQPTASRKESEPGKARVSAPPAAAVDDGLKRLYDAYPAHRRNCSRPSLIAAWEKAEGKPPIEALLFKLEEQKASHQWTKDSGQYVPNIVNYLVSEGWKAPVLPPPEPKFKSQADWNAHGKFVC